MEQTESVSRIDWPIRQAVYFIVLAIILFRFFIFGWHYLTMNSNSNAGDQGVTLQLGLDLKAQGVLSDGTRYPLYPALLLPFARREWSYFTWAKIISLLAGGLAVVMVFVLGRRIGPPAGALLAAGLLSINTEFLFHTTTALVEGLLVLVFWLGWYYVGRALTWGDVDRYWVLAGVFVALAYLTKGTGNLLLLVGGGTALIFYWRQPDKLLRGLLLFGATFVLVASPLLIYNLLVFGSPTYNFATTHAMWLDKWRESWVGDPSTLPTISVYFATHTPQEVLTRLLAGLQELWSPFWQTIIPFSAGWLENIVFSIWGWLIILAVGAVLILRYKTSLSRYWQQTGKLFLFSALLTMLLYLLFAWYTKIVIGTRFFLPILPILYFFLGTWFWLLFQRLLLVVTRLAKRNADYLDLLLKNGFFAGLAVWLLWTTGPQLINLQNPFPTDIENNVDTEHVLAWLVAGEPQGARVVWGPGHSLPIWKYSDRLEVYILPDTLESQVEIMDYLSQIKADYVILDELMVRRYKERFRDYIDYSSGRLELLRPIPGWYPAYMYKGYPCDWCVFRIAPQADFEPVSGVELNQYIRFLGYHIVDPDVGPGETVSIWLYWQSLAPLEQNYTIFAHLVGPGGLQGQLDRQPLHTLWPTSRWFPQGIVADRFDIPLAKDVPLGQYQIYLGMYDLETGQRLPLLKHGQPVPDNASIIDGISVSHEPS
jgi:hypothetical protein